MTQQAWVIDISSERFTDQDVRNFPELRSIAEEFIRDYRGDFDYLRAARTRYQLNNQLSVTEARGTLNCMRHDFRWMDRLVQLVSRLEIKMNHAHSDYRHQTQSAPKLEQLVVGSGTVRLRVDFHQRYMYSTHRYGKIVHILDNNKSYAVWHRADNSIKFYPIAWCQGGSYPMVKYSKYKIVTDDEPNPLDEDYEDNDKRICEVCRERKYLFCDR